ncbi:MAG: hypothetical protein PHU85_18790, partial [Phycisphaerae bacterium]|nr:hypothetical protein [Phycisphaerae bacterium]
MDIIVTTPKKEIDNAAKEAADCISKGGGHYFRRFSQWPRELHIGDWVWYVEDGYLRGRAKVTNITTAEGMICQSTRRKWPPGAYVVMDATSWRWVKPIPLRGFLGFRYFCHGDATRMLAFDSNLLVDAGG